MDVVELPVPAAVAVLTLMGSDGFGGVGGSSGGGVGVTVEEVEARELDRVSILVSPSIDRCSSFLSQKDEVGAVRPSESAFWKKTPDVEIRRASQLSSFHGEDASDDLNFVSTNSCQSLMPRLEAKELKKKSGKVSRSSSGCSKRSRMAQMEVSINEHGADDIKGTSNELGSYSAKCNIAERNQMAKQKNNLNGKRGDKRNGKIPLKSKYDTFSLKAGLSSFGSSVGGNNNLGVYGSKQDSFDVTKHVDELSLNELLDGSYKCPSFTKDKGKKAANSNETFLNSVRSIFSILRLRKPIRPQNSADIDNSCNHKVTTCLVSSGSCVAGRSDGDRGDTYTKDRSSCNKMFHDSCGCSKLKSPAHMPDFPLYQPEDILERLALPPPKDLESLLLDASKPALPSRNNSELRLGKPVSNRAGLPPFPWSHTSGGHYKSSSDAAKFSTTRTNCQGRWVKIESSATSLNSTTSFLVDFESLTYDHSLVPSVGPNLGPSENKNVPSTSISFLCERSLSASATISRASKVPPESGGGFDCQDNAGHSPIRLAAAQTLYDIATNSPRKNPHDMIKWPKKSTQKAMKARKLKSNEKSEEIFATPNSVTRPNDVIKNVIELLPAKKPRLSINEKSNGLGHAHTMRKVPVTWAAPRSSRSSPSKLLRDSVVEPKHYSPDIVKQSSVIPPSTRVLDKACNGQQKLRRLVPMERNWSGGKLD
ncbi:uncharacterized protein LOC132282176 isoform X1 [Cornus florida]|uniref:uncharacterized protein LOC132282176 isoform X1 n=1 Tax=Cornus florida TaxID=4283 RepID=UPI00289CCE6F|nr:uncharacterized protein LOC132282176 isoform X1 [Cornus florida]